MASVARNIAVNYVGTIWVSVVQIIFIPIYIHYLGIASYGLIGIYASLMVWMGIADFGITPTLTREMSKYSTGVNSDKWINNLVFSIECILGMIALTVVLSGVVMSSWLAKHWLHSKDLNLDQIRTSLIFIFVSGATKWLTTVYKGGLYGLQDHVWINFTNILFATTRSVGVLPLIILTDSDVRTYFAFFVIVNVIELLFSRRRLKDKINSKKERKSFDIGILRHIFRFASGVAAISLLGVGLTQGDKIILPKILGLETFGAYAFASSICSILLMLSSPIFNAVYPKLSEFHSEGKQRNEGEVYEKASELIVVIVSATGLAMIFFGQKILLLWSQNPGLVLDMAPYFKILVLANMLFSITHVPYALQLARGWTDISIKVNFAALLIYFPLLIVLVPKYGAVSAAYSWLLINAVFFLVQVSIVNRRAGIVSAYDWLLRKFSPPFFSSLAFFLMASWWFDGQEGISNVMSVIEILVMCLLGLLVATIATRSGRSISIAMIRRKIVATNGQGE